MFCKYCGQQLPDDAEFCTRCGRALSPKASAAGAGSEPVPAGAAAGGATATSAAPEPELDRTVARPFVAPVSQPTAPATSTAPAPAASPVTPTAAAAGAAAAAPVPTRKRRWPLVAAVCAVLVAIACTAAFFLVGPGANHGTPVAYGSTETVAASRITKIVPAGTKAGDGALTHYYVRIVDASGADTTGLDLFDLPKIEVKDNQGFTLPDISDKLPRGTYTVRITDAGASSGTDGGDVRLQYDPSKQAESSAPKQLTPGPSNGSNAGSSNGSAATSTRQGRYGAYLGVIEDLQKKYGKAAITASDGAGWLTGLFYAQLVDFGDGTRYLVVAYCTEPGVAQVSDLPTGKVFKVAVYSYNAKTDKANRLMEDDLSYTNGGFAFLTYGHDAAGKKTYLIAGDGYAAENYYGLTDKGSFGPVALIKSQGQDGEGYTNYLNGKVATSAQIEEQQKAHANKPDTWYVSGWSQEGSSSSDPESYSGGASAYEYLYGEQGERHTIGETGKTVADLLGKLQGLVGESTGSSAGDSVGKTDGSTTQQKGKAESAVPTNIKATDHTESVTTLFYDVPEGSEPTKQTQPWNYVQLSGDGGSAVLAKINKALKQAYDTDKAASTNFKLGAGKNEVVQQWQSVTYTGGDYVAVKFQRFVRPDGRGTRGVVRASGAVYSVKTGERVKVLDAVGLTQAQFESEVTAAATTYIDFAKQDGSASIVSTPGEAAAKFAATDPDAILTKDGLVVCIPQGTFQINASGTHLMLVHPSKTTSLGAGTDVTETYMVNKLQ